jgi:hypothetical protein
VAEDVVAGNNPQVDWARLPNAELEINNFVNMVRIFMRDHSELNRLIAGEESSNRQIMWAIMDALDDYNTEPPFTRFGILSFPSRSLLIRATVISLLTSVGLLQTRNHLQFSDGGITVGINDKTQFLQAWIQLLKGEYEEKKKKLKVAYNIESAWDGGVNSEYRFVNNFYGEW